MSPATSYERRGSLPQSSLIRGVEGLTCAIQVSSATCYEWRGSLTQSVIRGGGGGGWGNKQKKENEKGRVGEESDDHSTHDL